MKDHANIILSSHSNAPQHILLYSFTIWSNFLSLLFWIFFYFSSITFAVSLRNFNVTSAFLCLIVGLKFFEEYMASPSLNL